MRRKSYLWLAALAMMNGASFAGVATFDSLAEGFYGDTSLVNDGITFFAPNSRIGSSSVGTFAVDDVSQAIAQFPEFAAHVSSPNILGVTTYGPGADNIGFGRFGEIHFTTGSIQNYASVDVYHLDDGLTIGNEISLIAFLVNQPVAVDSVPLTSFGFHYDLLHISDVDFDSLILVGTGPIQNGVFWGGIDNVTVVPEPTSKECFGALVLVSLLLLRVRGRRIQHGVMMTELVPNVVGGWWRLWS